MSHIALPTAELKPALVGLGKVLNKNSSLPVLSTVKVERTTDGWITLTATDLDTFATVRLEQPTDGAPEVLLVPYDALVKTVKSCGKDEQIIVQRIDDATVSIKYAIGQQYAEQKIETEKVDEFPPIPRIRGDAISLPESLRESLHQAIECSSTDETRYVLNGAYLDVSDEKCHHIVGTDGRHLYSSNSFSVALEKSLIIRSHRFLSWKVFDSDGAWQLKTAPGEKEEEPGHVQISTRRWRFITREVDGTYPNWRQVVPRGDELKTHFDIEAGAVEQVLQTILRMPSHDPTTFAIGIEVENKKVRLLGKSQTAEYWTKVEIPAFDIIGPSMTTFLNRELLTKALKFGLTAVDLTDAMSPMIFSDGGRRMIVMPVRSETPPPTPPSTPAATGEAHTSGETEPETAPTAASPTTAAQPTERKPMINPSPDNADSNSQVPATKGAKIDEALELIDSLKDSLQEGLTGLKDLGGKLKLLQKEQKTTEREVQSIRSTLRSLQGVKL